MLPSYFRNNIHMKKCYFLLNRVVFRIFSIGLVEVSEMYPSVSVFLSRLRLGEHQIIRSPRK